LRLHFRETLIPLALFAGALTLSLIRLVDEPYNPDEGRWIRQGQRSWELLIAGDFAHPFWNESDLYYGRESPAVAKYLIGMTAQLCNQSAEEKGEAPSPGLLWAGRFSSALLGAFGLVAFYALARRVAGVSAAVVGAVLLSVSPIWLPATRRAMVDVHAAALGLATVYTFLRGYEGLGARRGYSRPILWLLVAAIMAGLAVGSKFNAAGVPFALGLLLAARLVGSLFASGDERRRTRALAILMAGALFAVVALATFVASYPYVHHDTVSRLREILAAWRSVRTQHVELGPGPFAGSYYPGWKGFTELVSSLLLPGRLATGLLVLPLAGALGTWLRPLRSLQAANRHVLIWSLAVPAAVAGVLETSRVVHHWVLWVGLVGGLTVFLSRGGFRLSRGEEGTRLLVPVAVLLGTLLVTLATTCITWPRYYLQLIPWLCLFAGLGIARLGAALRQLGVRRARTLVALSALLGCMAVLAAYPHPGKGKMARITEASWDFPPRILSTLSAAGFCLFPLLLRPRDFRAAHLDRSNESA
jgi:4-amino-4-deoxy-L-arabinose transferase-like glycosyltransferase